MAGKRAVLDEVVEQFPLGEAALLHLLAVSSICATRLTRNPETLLWLSQPEVCLASRGYAEMLAALHVSRWGVCDQPGLRATAVLERPGDDARGG